MKQIISIFAIAGITLVGASCNTSAVREKEAALEAQQKTIDSMKVEIAKQQVIDSMNEVARTQYVIPQMINATPEVKSVAKTTPKKKATTTKRRTTRSSAVARTSNSGSSNGGYTNNYPTQPVYQEPVSTPPVVQAEPQKKGWSAKAKGAVIGAGAGAIGGAVINKQNRAKGAIIGGIIGAAGGLGAGAIIDKKNGR